MPEPSITTQTTSDAGTWLTALDGWMARNPWHPRVTPFLVYIAFLPLISLGRSWSLTTYPLLYALQTGLVAWLLWRYRRLLPELTLRFHWLAVPVGVGVIAAWIALGEVMIALSPSWFGPEGQPHYFEQMRQQSAGLYWLSLVLRLLGMSLLVPLFEELFVRSACLRGLHSARKTGVAMVQLLEDVPLVGEWVMESKLGKRFADHPPMFTQQLTQQPLGALTAFGVTASTLVFMVNHVMRDWPGAIVCGLAWCALVGWTNRAGKRPLGLGPVVWSHAVANACLWAWCVWYGDWKWM